MSRTQCDEGDVLTSGTDYRVLEYAARTKQMQLSRSLRNYSP
jgi:hypothetical protein